MTHVSTPDRSALPRQRTQRLGSMVGAVALVVATGAAIAVGIAVSTDDAPAVAPSGETFTQVREGQSVPGRVVDNSDVAHLNRAASVAATAIGTTNSADTAHINRATNANTAAIGTTNSADIAHLNRADSAGAQATRSGEPR